MDPSPTIRPPATTVLSSTVTHPLHPTATSTPTPTSAPSPSGFLRLTNDPANDTVPAWSPDGKSIAFVSDRTGSYELFVMGNPDSIGEADAVDIKPEQLTADPASIHKHWPTWSPDGRRIAMMVMFDVERIFALDLEAYTGTPLSAWEGDLQPLTEPMMDGWNPDWSPDGKKIAFETYDSFGEWQVYVLNIDTGVLQQVTEVSGSVFGPKWSPDGRHIAFTTDMDGDSEIYIVNLDGKGLLRLTDHSGSDSNPDWSPDGRFIVFVSNRDGPYELYMMRADGSDLSRLTWDEAIEDAPTWSPDGRYIAFVSTRDGNREIYRMDAPQLEP